MVWEYRTVGAVVELEGCYDKLYIDLEPKITESGITTECSGIRKRMQVYVHCDTVIQPTIPLALMIWLD